MGNKASSGTNKVLVVLAMIAALGVVTAGHYFFRFVKVDLPGVAQLIFCIFLVLLILTGYLTLYRLASGSYKVYRRLTPSTLFAMCCVWGLFLALPSLLGPYDWAWNWRSEVAVPPPVALAVRLLIMAGLLGLLVSAVQLGLLSTVGHGRGRLITNGVYGFSRNPQFLFGSLFVLGIVILRPSWFAAGWAGLYPLLVHWMVKAEEEHLTMVFGEKYDVYRKNTPRFLFKKRM